MKLLILALVVSTAFADQAPCATSADNCIQINGGWYDNGIDGTMDNFTATVIDNGVTVCNSTGYKSDHDATQWFFRCDSSNLNYSYRTDSKGGKSWYTNGNGTAFSFDNNAYPYPDPFPIRCSGPSGVCGSIAYFVNSTGCPFPGSLRGPL